MLGFSSRCLTCGYIALEKRTLEGEGKFIHLFLSHYFLAFLFAVRSLDFLGVCEGQREP